MSDPASVLGPLVATVSQITAATEDVLYRMATLRFIAAADERRFVDRATKEVEESLSTLGKLEELRAQYLEMFAAEVDVPARELTLERLADEFAPEGVSVALRAARSHLVALNDELQELRDEISRLIDVNLSQLNSDISAVGTGAYSASGRPAPPPARTKLSRPL